ncbi:alkene reductase [Parasphingopyxis algicola]|uniref:alkene reductase n=1 Tax=Parasphingopyxis algicola TaxID=2026624 RepID=UPI0015A488D4|nr:alkene reductase [Parasphingopyxis algicola]QLC26500.1 alkene reductase [Parasphingopyxis algicola]
MNRSPLFTPCRVGDVALPNRIVMAPMTRLRAPGAMPNALMADYYSQRASAGLIITECTMVSDTSAAYMFAPGIYSDAFIAPWRAVTDTVHEAGGRIFLQLWHSGRVAHVSLMPGGEKPYAPSAIRGEGELHTPEGKKRVSTPREMTVPHITGLTKAFGKAAERARQAGFDGIEIHGAFGYLVDQFLQDGSNQRSDHYGGSFENRIRFLLGVVSAVQQAFGNDVGLKLSPSNRYHGMSDSDPEGLFGFLLSELGDHDLAYLHMMEPLPFDHEQGHAIADVKAFAARHYDGTIIANGGFDAATAARAIADGEADLVSFAQLFIANPDLPRRFREDLALAAPDFAKVYGAPGMELSEGYIDYPAAD